MELLDWYTMEQLKRGTVRLVLYRIVGLVQHRTVELVQYGTIGLIQYGRAWEC